jgi:hypothetical protein
VSYTELRLLAEMFFDVQDFRKSAANKVRSKSIDPDVVGTAIDQYEKTEHLLGLELRRCMRRTVTPGILAWQKAQLGIGEHLLARLLGQIGDPRLARPMHWEGTGSKRHLVDDEPFDRLVSQLWSYCGHGDPARKRQRGMDADEAMGLGNPKAKMLVWNLATACVKAGVRNLDDGSKKAISHYGAFYMDARTRFEDRTHATECVRCGPSGKPAQVGSPWSPGHQHAASLRLLGKEILRDLWVASEK